MRRHLDLRVRDELQDGGDAAFHVVHGCSVGVEVLQARLFDVFGVSVFDVGGVMRARPVDMGWHVICAVGIGGGG